MLANSGADEHGRYSGGQAGDQTGKEWQVRGWYNRPWNCVLRYPNPAVGYKLAELSRAAALNDHIGYDQGQRMTYLYELERANWQPGMIRVDCEQDCSSGVIANTIAVGHLLNIDALKSIGKRATYTGNMRQAYQDAGFHVLTDGKYTSSSRYLLPGDILLNDQHHVAVNLDIGVAAKNEQIASDARKLSQNPKWVGECTASLLNVRSGPGTGYACIKEWPMLAKGNWIDVCDEVGAADGGLWYYIRIYGKYYGYVYAKYIKHI